MKHRPHPTALAALLCAASPVATAQQNDEALAPVIVTAPYRNPFITPALGGSTREQVDPAWGNDTAGTLDDIPGVSSQQAGGVSSLPVIHGLADERLRVQVDGMDLMAACPNHMNPALSYLPPALVGEVHVYAGVTPVSVGGDSIGGTIQVESAPLAFAQADAPPLIKGEAGYFFRSNGDAHGEDLTASYATEHFALRYSGTDSESGNYKAASAFKARAQGRESGREIPGDEVGSSAYHVIDQNVAVAVRSDEHLLQLNASWQNAPYEGFPNQRMDMTSNRNASYQLRYSGRYEWGQLRAQLWQQTTKHEMDMGPDRNDYGTGMPMNTWARTRGASLQADLTLNPRDTLRLGVERSHYLLYDWWPPVGTGSMAPNDFWNINGGTRDKSDVFAEWEAHWNTRWTTLLGLRHSRVASDTGDVQGYNGNASYAQDAAAFNAVSHARTDRNWDATALLRFEPDAAESYEAGLARKVRSPSLYQRYPWSTDSMAIGMNNFAGDGNGYVGNPGLKPEVAYTASVSGDWHDAADDPAWGLKTTAYLTRVKDYIDADRIDDDDSSTGFVMLRYANHDARLVGLDVSGFRQLFSTPDWGRVVLRSSLGWVRGTNTDTDDGLYSVMPLHGGITLDQERGHWRNTLELEGVAAKTHLSKVRNELRTAGYGLLNLRTAYTWQKLRIEAGIDNLLNHAYDLPLGGAYVGQGRTMMLSTVDWGTAVPGPGRSFNVALRLSY